MRNLIKGLVLGLSTSFFVACGGGDPVATNNVHQLAVYKIIDANKADPAKAATELEAYIKTHNEAIVGAAADVLILSVHEADKSAKLQKANEASTKEIGALREKLSNEAAETLEDPRVAKALNEIGYSIKAE